VVVLDKITILFKKALVAVLQILSVVLQIGLIIWIYSLMPINRIAIIISYIIIAPIITYILKKAFRSANFDKLYFISLFISSIVLSSIIIFLSYFKILEFNTELFNYISTLLFAILLYYVFGNEYSNKIYDVKTIKSSYAYSYFFISKDYNSYFIKTLIFIFYTFTLIFGQLRDLGIHNSSLFKCEQYAIILIIAIDRIINSFAKEFPRVKERMKSKKDKEKETFVQVLNDKLEEIKEQFKLLLRINPEYNIDKLDLWENANDSEHPQTKLLHLYLLFNVFSKDNGDKIDELFILTGKNVKRLLKQDDQS